MIIESQSSAISTLTKVKSGSAVQQSSRWIGSIFHRVGVQLVKVALRLKGMHDMDRLSGDMLRDIGLKRVNLPGVTPGLPGGSTGRFVRWS